MKIYLAARYSRRQELCIYREQLQEEGHVVTSRWLDGHHEVRNRSKTDFDVQSARDNLHEDKRRQFAQEDLDDLLAAKTIICFTETPRETKTRGGRHVEFGVAMALMYELIVIGPKENVFYSLDQVKQYSTWYQFMTEDAIMQGVEA